LIGAGVYYDVNNTDVSVQRIHHAASLRQPFLVAHGFIKPHLPWDYPPEFKAKYYGAFANGSRTVPPATNPTYPIGTSAVGFHQCAEMPVESLEVPFSAAKVSALRLEYFATISYVDQQIGRLLDALDETGVADRTAVLFLGALLLPLGDRTQQSSNFVLLVWC
jgi:iduronate 2-sulfatase